MNRYIMCGMVLVMLTGVTKAEYVEREVMNPSSSITIPHKSGSGYSQGYSHVRTNCFPTALNVGLGELSKKLGAKITVISGGRHGHGGSYHNRCQAADIRVHGVPSRHVYAAAKTVFNGVGFYGGSRGHVHVDVRKVPFYW